MARDQRAIAAASRLQGVARVKVAILGAGRMGGALRRCIEAAPALELAGVWSRSGGGVSDLDRLLAAADVAVDFTLPGATADVLSAAMRAGKPLVSGVTGLDDGQMRDVVEAARSIPLLYDRNMSLGIAVLAELVTLAAGSLGPAFAASVHEVHHLHKKDAPSGTALKLGEALAGARHQVFGEVCRYRPDETAARRAAGDIVISAERRGDVAGEHHVRFDSGAETLTLSHTVTDRGVFAAGALAAAAWLAGQPPGLYAMRDVIQARAAGGGQPSRDSVK